ncbi:alpha/beta fold hydrolase [Spirillospora sp. CA-294931]|uniref:alpha/beta fold hydrolase n=1 Tax=Spirillospora sp. CA-294931 TaxID=3240042 RepID=UPI003D8E184E
MPEVELSVGTIEYEDSGTGPVLVFLHGIHMDGAVWRAVAADLSAGHRCVVPTLPMGAHRHPMRPGTDLSMPGQARILTEFLDRLGLDAVTLVGNDTGGVVAQLLAGENAKPVERLVLTSCEAFDNFPPGLPGRVDAMSARMPGGLYLSMLSLRLKPLRRAPFTFGRMAKRPIPGDIFTGWLDPVLKNRAVRKDAVVCVRAVHRDHTRAAAEGLPSYDRPALVVWASEDRVMPPEHGRRLADLLPQATYAEIDDTYTLIPLDQPAKLASQIRDFVMET